MPELADHIDGGGCDSGDALDVTLSEISQVLNHLQSAEGTGWISVKERLPKIGRRVFVSVDGSGFRTRTTGIYTGDAWKMPSLEKFPCEKTWPIEGTVTHWRELPSPPAKPESQP